MAVIEERKGRNGSPVYRVKIRLKGRPALSRTFTRKSDAKIWARNKEAELEKERSFGVSAHSSKPVSVLIERYMREVWPQRRSEKAYVKTCLSWWNAEIGQITIEQLSVSALSECRDKLLGMKHKSHKFAGASEKRKTPRTVIRYLDALSHVFTVAVQEWEWMESNPIQRVKRPQLPRHRVRFLNDDEREALLQACKESSCTYLYPVVVIALSTGARYSEVMHLRWRDVDLERGVARLEKTKNQERRALTLAGRTLEVIRELHEAAAEKDGVPPKSAFLFPREDGLGPTDIRKHWGKALSSAKVEDFRFHDLRHTFASYLAMNGASLLEIAAALGHKTLQMVQRYAHLTEQHTSDVVTRMNEKMMPANDNQKEPRNSNRRRS